MAALCGRPRAARAPRALRVAVRRLGSANAWTRAQAEACLRANPRHAVPLLRQTAIAQSSPTRAVRAALMLHRFEERDGVEIVRRLAHEQRLHVGEAGSLLRYAVREAIGPDIYARQATAALMCLEQRPDWLAALRRFRHAMEMLRFLRVSLPCELLARALVVRTVGGENLSLVRLVLAGAQGVSVEHVCMARKEAVEMLVSLQDGETAYSLLAANVGHPSPAVKLSAMHGLERLNDSRAVGPLMPLARDVDNPVCEEARRLIVLLRGETSEALTLLRAAEREDLVELLRPITHWNDHDAESLVRPLFRTEDTKIPR